MNQLCKVCGEPAAGFHFGAFTCEGCKSFFGRTYNNLGSISECKNNSECVINKKNRTACKACRLRKCLLVGMSKSGSRYGRRSNWFKIHCLLQEQQQQQQAQVGGGGGGGMNNHPASASSLLRPHPYLPFFQHRGHHVHHHHHLQLPPLGVAASTRDSRSSESDSGASSADPDDDLRSTSSALSFLKLPPTSPSSEPAKMSAPVAPPPPALQAVADATSWRDLWLKGALALPMTATPATPATPDHEQPIDLSVRQTRSPPPPPPPPLPPLAHRAPAPESSAAAGFCKSAPLDLTLERQPAGPQIAANL